MMDALAFEPQFLDHLAPVWRELPERGRLFVDSGLMSRAHRLGLIAEPVDLMALKTAQPVPPNAKREPGPIAFAVSIGDIKVGRRLGYRRFVFMEHGAGQAYIGDRAGRRDSSYSGGIDREDVELFLVPNEYSAGLWRQSYAEARVDIVGCPKLDTLPAREPGTGPVICLSFHWPAFAAPEARTAVGHYLSVFARLAQEFQVIGHAHPKGDWQERMRRLYDRAGIPFVADFEDVCRQADVYVCDNSSTLFEFAATGRPVVVLNSPDYRRNVSHGLRFWEAADVGVQCDGPDELIPAIRKALADGPAQRANREAALDIVYQPRTGASGLATAAIAAWIATAERVAA